ncbi:hypothetical protein [Streptomyces sp. NPDC057694]|uniref:hypothetical protein n=1 Tax=Streptomyces sp. NPDC057694 TaxID=3346216 RepID=UPI00369AAC59
MSHARTWPVRTLSVLALSAAALALPATTASAADQLTLVRATAAGDHVEVQVRYRCEELMGTDTLAVSLANTEDGGVYSASTAPECDGSWHETTVATARGAGPAARAGTDAVITASLGIGPDPQVFPTASTRSTLTLHSPR